MPWLGLLTALMLSTWPSVVLSTSLSLASSLAASMVSAVSSKVLVDSPTATGISLTAATLMLTVALLVPPLPSLTV